MLNLATTMAAYNRSMNERLYEICAQLTDTERKRDASAFFKSIHGTLNHLLLGDRLWLGRFTTQSFEVCPLDTELYADFDELRKQRSITDATIIAWVETLPPDKLQSTFEYALVGSGKQNARPLWFAITHFFNHQTHHRGQLTTLLSQQSIDPGSTDLIAFPLPINS